jgi:hypothetical protein
MEVGQRVKLNSFNGRLSPIKSMNKQENYWKLIGEMGTICQDPKQESVYASFSKKSRVLVKFDSDICNYNLVAHNSIQNSLWILVSDLEFIGK